MTELLTKANKLYPMALCNTLYTEPVAHLASINAMNISYFGYTEVAPRSQLHPHTLLPFSFICLQGANVTKKWKGRELQCYFCYI